MIWLGIAARWALMRTVRWVLMRYVLFGDPTIAQAQRRARRWGFRLQLRLADLGTSHYLGDGRWRYQPPLEP